MSESSPSAAVPLSARLARLFRRRLTWAALVLAALLALAAGTALRRGDSTEYFTAKVSEGEIKDVVESTGTVSAVITVQVGSQVSGTISRLAADFNSRVRKGDVIAEIAPELFQGALLQASADLANAKANVIAAEAALDKAQAALVQTKADHDRAAALAAQNIESRQNLDLTRANYEAAKASVAGAKANIVQAQAQMRQKEAAVSVAKTNLDYTVIRSPIDGTVVARNVDVGQTVAASLQAPTIFTIAQDLTKMQVYAKVDEGDVGRIKMGQKVTFKVDAFPKEAFRGAVSQIRMNPTRVQNVVTYDTIIDFDNPDRKLYPGMTAYVTIPVATAEKVVRVPNAALRFKPPIGADEQRRLLAKYGVEESGAGNEGAPSRRQGPGESAIVWKRLADGSLEPARIALGITDHTVTEVVAATAGTLRPGDDVVTSAISAKAGSGPGVAGARR